MMMMPFSVVVSATTMLLLISRASAFTTRPTTSLHQIRHLLSSSSRSSQPTTQQLFASTTTTISFDPSIDVRDKATSTIVVGRHSTLKSLIEKQDAYVSLFGFRPHPDILSSMHESITGNQATTSHVIVPTVGPAIPRPPHRLTLCSLQNKVTRNNHPLSLHSMTDLVKSSVKGKGPVRIMVLVEDEYPLGPIAGAISKAFPVFNRKTSSKKTESDAEEDSGDDNGQEEEDRMIHVTFLDSKGKIVKNDIEINAAREAAEGVRLACRLVDTHPEELTTTAFAQECHDLFDDDDTVTIEEIVGEELKEKGYGGIYNVGKGATHPPRLVIMTYEPPKDVLTDDDEEQSAITLVGKGIVYDTGGLAIKTRTGMCGMKHDMGGAAGVLGGFAAAVRLRTPRKIRLMLCLAENAIGPNSVRNDDIITQYSGKTVEINNSDAEVSSWDWFVVAC